MGRQPGGEAATRRDPDRLHAIPHATVVGDVTRLRLRPDDTPLLYTDGITDTRTPAGRLGQDGLIRFLAAGDTTPTAVINQLDALLADPTPDRRDDIAALALAVVPGPSGTSAAGTGRTVRHLADTRPVKPTRGISTTAPPT